ncbi:hypothetical protein [Oceanibium sediminis]|uniref:hypothetical protein n=1 Tax=Oceanibium sediminis TaxID=2026339 RepID=UPI001300690A|nr:hypothetical protein [Oceanibium sediminis]
MDQNPDIHSLEPRSARTVAWIDRRAADMPARQVVPPTLFTPHLGDLADPGALVMDALPDLMHSTGILRARAGWLADGDGADTRRISCTGRAIARQAARLETSMGAIIALAAAGMTPRIEEGVDPNALLTRVHTARCGDRPEAVDFLCEMPVCATDPVVFSAIGAALLDAGLGAARRAGDVIGFRAIRAGQVLRLSVIFPGPPIVAEARGAIFSGRPSETIPPPTALALAMLWQGVACLGGQIEVGEGPRGGGARITAILPFMAPRNGEDPP